MHVCVYEYRYVCLFICIGRIYLFIYYYLLFIIRRHRRQALRRRWRRHQRDLRRVADGSGWPVDSTGMLATSSWVLAAGLGRLAACSDSGTLASGRALGDSGRENFVTRLPALVSWLDAHLSGLDVERAVEDDWEQKAGMSGVGVSSLPIIKAKADWQCHASSSNQLQQVDEREKRRLVPQGNDTVSGYLKWSLDGAGLSHCINELSYCPLKMLMFFWSHSVDFTSSLFLLLQTSPFWLDPSVMNCWLMVRVQTRWNLRWGVLMRVFDDDHKSTEVQAAEVIHETRNSDTGSTGNTHDWNRTNN